jgi:predicted DNA-binding transcriptional regulator
MRDKTLGILISVGSLICMVGYFLWAFGPFIGLSHLIPRELSEWAFKIPIVLAVYALLAIALWIGYTMATTPPPLPLEKPLELEREEVSLKGEEDKG